MALDVTTVVAPTLSDDGWVFSSARMADYLMAWAMASDYSQSYLFKNKITSFGWLVAKYSNQPTRLMDEAKTLFTTLFSRYFTGVTVECTDQTQPATPNQFILGLYIGFTTSDGTAMNIAQLAQIANSKFVLINNIISNGDAS